MTTRRDNIALARPRWAAAVMLRDDASSTACGDDELERLPRRPRLAASPRCRARRSRRRARSTAVAPWPRLIEPGRRNIVGHRDALPTTPRSIDRDGRRRDARADRPGRTAPAARGRRRRAGNERDRHRAGRDGPHRVRQRPPRAPGARTGPGGRASTVHVGHDATSCTARRRHGVDRDPGPQHRARRGARRSASPVLHRAGMLGVDLRPGPLARPSPARTARRRRRRC